MKRGLLLLVIVGALVAGNCGLKKTDVEPACGGSCTVITGRFTTDGRKTALAGVPLALEWVKFQGFSATVHRKAAATTDANGGYTLRFHIGDDELKDGVYHVSYDVDAGQYITDRDKQGFAVLGYDLKRDTVVTSDWLLPRKAYLHLDVAGPAQITEYFAAEYSYGRGAYASPDPFNYSVVEDLYSYSGPGVTSADVEIAANQPVELKVDKTKNGQRTVQRDTIMLAPGAHYTQRITY